eukprot:6247384-Prorocentrum_lima.AAC.1
MKLALDQNRVSKFVDPSPLNVLAKEVVNVSSVQSPFRTPVVPTLVTRMFPKRPPVPSRSRTTAGSASSLDT